MQQLDRFLSHLNLQRFVNAHLAQAVAITSDLRPIIAAWPYTYLYFALRPDDKWAVA